MSFELETDGFAFLPDAIGPGLLAELRCAFEGTSIHAGTRHLIDHPGVRSVLHSRTLLTAMRNSMRPATFAYKATLFDKNAGANWLVAWHRDVTIPVVGRAEIDGWSAWSVKDGVQYASPPRSALAKLLAVRINLDESVPENGPLRVLPGTHRTDAASNGSSDQGVVLLGKAGDAWLMRPTLLHASSKGTAQSRRRVLHLEFADFDLPDGVQWHRRVPLPPH